MSDSCTVPIGSAQLAECKRQDCPFYTADGVGIMESPNFPREYPVSNQVAQHYKGVPGK